MQAIVQVPTRALRMQASRFKTEFHRGGALQQVVLRYIQCLLVHIAQDVACNRLHRVEERLARWLLTIHDRVESNELPLTQEFIGQMLGTGRASITTAANELQESGTISYRRGLIKILDRHRLEAASCECYECVNTAFQKLLL
ncbi:MAG TPA: helix-turn-helix domain-containing protein [Leptolyngbyaceae cyanobacterium]